MGSSDSRLSDTVASSVLSAREASTGTAALSGKVALITGPTAGIGYETARVLAKHGCHVVLAARDMKKLSLIKEKLKEDIKKEKGEGFTPLFTELKLNLGSLESVRNAANQFNQFGLPLHYLIANAGVFSGNAGEVTEDKFEAQVGTNHLGHYYLTRLLLTNLRSSATPTDPARIVIVASRAHRRAPIRTVEDIEKSFLEPCTSLFAGYGRSKLYNIYHANHLATTEKSNNILAFSLHPGVIATDIARSSSIGNFFWKQIGSYFMKNPNQGASTTIHCTLAATSDQSGHYFGDNQLVEPDPIAKNQLFQQKLIEVSEKLINDWEASHPVDRTASSSSSSTSSSH